ncbi:antigen [Sarotherodon galilaeus]
MDTQDVAELCFPQLFNTSCKKPAIPRSIVMFSYIVLSSISFLTVALNLLVIISVSHYRQLHTSTNILLLSLAVSDFLVGVLVIPGEILRNTACWTVGQLTCLLYIFVSLILTSASVGIMVLISVERYVAICDPLHYPTRITHRRVKLCVCLCWLCSIAFSCLLVRDDLHQKSRHNSCIGEYDLHQKSRHNSCIGECIFQVDFIVGVFDLILTFIVPVSSIVVLYLRVFAVVLSHARAMRSHVTAVTLQQSVTLTAKKSQMKAARTLGVLIVVFLLCFCPYYCVSLIGDDFLNGSSAAIVIYVFYFNSCINPVIYAMFYFWFRKAVKHIVTLQILRSGSSEVNIL